MSADTESADAATAPAMNIQWTLYGLLMSFGVPLRRGHIHSDGDGDGAGHVARGYDARRGVRPPGFELRSCRRGRRVLVRLARSSPGRVEPAGTDRQVVTSPSGTTWIAASRTSSRKRFSVDPFSRISHRDLALWPKITCVIPSRWANAIRPSAGRRARTRTTVAPSSSARVMFRCRASRSPLLISPEPPAASRRKPRTSGHQSVRRSVPRSGAPAARPHWNSCRPSPAQE